MSKRNAASSEQANHSDDGETTVNEAPPRAISYTSPQHSRQAAFSLLWLFVASCAMFSLPFAAFFGVRNYLEVHDPDATTFKVTAYSVLAAVLTTNAIIVAYALLGYHETEYDEDGRVVDQSGPPKALPTQQTAAKKRKPLKEQ